MLTAYIFWLDREDIARNFIPLGLHVANEADITLPRAHYASSIRSSSIARESENGIDSQDFESGGIDLGLDMGDDTISIEYGREARSERASSVASRRRQRSMSMLSGVKSVRGDDEDVLRLGSDAGDNGMDIDLGGQELDLGLDLGGGFGDIDMGGDAMDVDMNLNDEDRERARRESTRLSTPPPLDEQDPSSLGRDLSPGVAERIAEIAAQQEQRAERAKPKKRVRIAAVDDDIELEDGVGRRDVTAILGEVSVCYSYSRSS